MRVRVICIDNEQRSAKIVPHQYDIDSEVERYFDETSVSGKDRPLFVVIAGGVAAGKTTLRKEKYSTGYVLVDAAEIFLNLSRGESFDTPEPFAEEMEHIGQRVADRAIAERRHIVTEIIGAEPGLTAELLDAMKSAGYAVNLVGVTCDIETAEKRNQSRSFNNISAYHAESYQQRWLIDSAIRYAKEKQS